MNDCDLTGLLDGYWFMWRDRSCSSIGEVFLGVLEYALEFCSPVLLLVSEDVLFRRMDFTFFDKTVIEA